VGGQVVRLNGFLRATEDIDILLPRSLDNGRRVIRALGFLEASSDLDPGWFDVDPEDPENIRIADDLLIDLSGSRRTAKRSRACSPMCAHGKSMAWSSTPLTSKAC
jgi:hypothetical protein